MMDPATQYDPSLELWRLPKVVAVTGQSKTTIWRMIKAGKFPAARQIGATMVAWRSTEVIAWMHEAPPASKSGNKQIT